ncbi:hypothetical protein EDF56_105374 [Novosphingobium sp. PhB165]|uniref:hypothetical protein n=1 Tax=Novosphingobium sp. PhB165 TaxID=2485105 RepID=UPI001042DE65|nr:hypothetical protein [Novosphingobium sp. PhB165]TCM18025.1 hypothetical protein EDF56_105374 [Novosphingobium sp. PhB165]
MIRKIFAIAVVAGLLGASPAMAASSCRDAHGKFVKCPTASAQKAPPAAATAKGKDGKCRYTSGPNKGKFAKCP